LFDQIWLLIYKHNIKGIPTIRNNGHEKTIQIEYDSILGILGMTNRKRISHPNR
jgi:hypothetical protein